MDRLGLGYEVLRQSNPRLIYCALSGYGLTGPDATKGGFDLVAPPGAEFRPDRWRSRRRGP